MKLLLWILWILLIFAGCFFCFCVYCIFSARMWRKKIVSEFADYVKKMLPDIVIHNTSASFAEPYIDFQRADNKGRFYPHKLISAVMALSFKDRDKREQIYEEFFKTLLSNTPVDGFSYQKHSDFIRPQLVTAGQLAGFDEYGGIPHLALDSLGLYVVYVLDNEQNMQYLDNAALKELGISVNELHELALSNLRKTFPEQAVRAVIEKATMELIASHDCYDAARILLIPGYLQENEKLAAAIPDRDTLGLAPIPENNDISGLQKLAETPFNTDKLLINRPIHVAKNGFELM